MRVKQLRRDYYVAYAVLLQSFLVVLQHLLITVFHMEAESTTIYRVVLTAIPLSGAILITLYRKWYVFLNVYVITIVILLCNIILFPQNEEFLMQNSLRFLLPVVIPSTLCLMFISNIVIIESVLYKISWFTTFLALIYLVSYLNGKFSISVYNMGFSYGLLLPMLSLYSNKKPHSVIASLFLFIIILGVGSRGAAIIYIAYVLYDAFQSYRKQIILIILFLVAFLLILPHLADWFESLGVSSRTLGFLSTNNITHMTGRDVIYENLIIVFWNNPIKGIGLFGDRFYLDGGYSHNIILELYLNWGLLIASFIIIYFLRNFFVIYKTSNKTNRNIIVKYFSASVAPLLFSGSYLVDYNLGIFIGILFLIKKTNRCDFQKKEYKTHLEIQSIK